MIQYLVFLGAVVQLMGIYVYIKETLKGNTKPNRVTWFLWSLAPFIATAAALSEGVKLSVLPVFMSGFGPFLVFCASFFNKNSYWKLEKFDYICAVFSILALVLWGLTKEPLIAIFFSILSDLFAGIPTLKKAWLYPETESIEAYTTGLFNVLTSFAAIKTWNFAALAFPFYLVLINSIFIFTVKRKNLFTFAERKI